MNTSQNLAETPASRPGRPATGAYAFVSGCALLGTIGIFVSEAGADPLTATWFRCAFGLAGLTVWVALRRQTRFLRLTGITGPWLLVAASLMVVSWGLFFTAIERMPAGIAIVLFHVQPMWVLVLSALCFKEAVGRSRIVAVMAAMCGLVLATGIGEHAAGTATQQGYWFAVVLCLVGAFCMAWVTLLARRLRDLPACILAWWQCALGTLTLWIWPVQHGWPALGAAWFWLAGLGIMHTGVAYTLMYSGIARLRTDRIALLQYVYPAVAILVDWLYFGRHFSGLQMTGIVIVSIAIWFAERAPAQSKSGAGAGNESSAESPA